MRNESPAPIQRPFKNLWAHHPHHTIPPPHGQHWRAPPRRRAERASMLCGEHSSTLRQVLEYSPQSTIRDSARHPSAFTVRDRRFPLPLQRDCHTPPPDIRRSGAARKIPPCRPAGRRRHVAPRESVFHLDYKSLHSSWISARAPERRGSHKTISPGGPPWMAACRGRLFFRVGRVTGSRPGLSARLRRWSAT